MLEPPFCMLSFECYLRYYFLFSIRNNMMLRAKVSAFRGIVSGFKGKVSEFKGKVSLYPTRDETRALLL